MYLNEYSLIGYMVIKLDLSIFLVSRMTAKVTSKVGVSQVGSKENALEIQRIKESSQGR